MSKIEAELGKMVANHLNDALRDQLVKDMDAYKSPVKDIFDCAVAENYNLIKSTFDGILKEAFSSEDFQKELRRQVIKKLAQTVVAQTGSVTDKQLNQLKQDPVFKAQMTLLINQALSPDLGAEMAKYEPSRPGA